MPDGLEGFEAMLGAFANLGEKETGLTDARCPKCNAADFVKVSDLFYDTVRHAENAGRVGTEPIVGGMSEGQIIAKFTPPARRSAVTRTILITLPVAVIAFLVYRRFGDVPGQFALVGTITVALMVFLTTTRRLSDQYYDARATWNRLYLCRKCGQVVKG